MGQRHEDLPVLLLEVPDDLFDGGVAAGVTVLVPQPLEDATFGVPLLAVDASVLPQDLLDDPQVRPDLPLLPWLALPVAGRLDVLQDLDQRVPVDPELATHAPLAAILDLHQPANLYPLLHVRKHPCWPSLSSSLTGTSPVPDET